MTVALPKPFFSAYADICLIASSAFKTVERTGVYERAIERGERKRRFDTGFFRIDGARHNHDADLEVVLAGEFVISFIVGGHAHDRAGAVIHENVIGHPDGDTLAVVGIHGEVVSVDSVLLDLADVAHFFGFALLGDQLIDLGAQRVVVAE